jgi:DNA-directed RNA polymerase subunit RPC12/RpoP
VIDLEVIEGPERGRSFRFTEADSFLVGRSPRAHLCLDPVADQYISRTHCLVDVRPPRCLLTDLGSTNGTFVNGARISQVELGDGDLLRVGHTVIRVRVESSPTEALHTTGLTCAQCGGPLDQTAGLLSPLTRNIVCPRCLEQQQRIHAAQVAMDQELRAEYRMHLCALCRKDVSEAAQDDRIPVRFQEVLYLCRECVAEQIDHGIDTKRLGSYRVLNVLGRGGMGMVFRGVHKASGRVCAIKRILPEVARDERARRMFEREIDIQTNVEHPHLVRVWDRARDDEEALYFVTEYMAGGDMERLITKIYKSPMEPRLACRLIRHILLGVQELHDHGMVHRDLKPGNFLLSRPIKDPQCVAKISDYGLAKCFEEAGNSVFDFTIAGQVAGSLMYMPPEQITNYRFVRPPSDVYAIGVSLYFLLSASYTVESSSPLDRRSRRRRPKHPVELIVEEPPVPLRERMPRMPEQVAAVVDRAVQKDLGQRYQTADDMRMDLDRAMAGLGWAID